jgi:putative PIN family toxin of toxin-antitoxin system
MSRTAPKVVYDCNVFVQALINLAGPAARCVQKAKDGEVLLFVSPFVLAEVRAIHPKLPPKYGITPAQTDQLALAVALLATVVTDVPHVYTHPYDPDDSAYVNLALKADARLIVSRDHHLLMLSDPSRKEGQEFRARFPSLGILDPVAFLRELDRPRI